MRQKIFLLIIFLVFLFAPVAANENAVLIKNSRQEIDACNGKLMLKLVRVWGGDDEEDEAKFFKSPTDIQIDSNNRVFICDRYQHHVKVFTRDGKYIKTIGQKGQGPGDLYFPTAMTIAPNGDLVVYEGATHRLQVFSPKGKSKRIIKKKETAFWIGINSKNQYFVYQRAVMLETKKLLNIWDENGKEIGTVGFFHDKTTDRKFADRYYFAMDKKEQVYVVNGVAPVIRKYSPDGRMLMAIVYEPPFEIPVTISLNERGNEIRREEPPIKMKSIIVRSGKSIYIEKGKRRPWLAEKIAVGSQDRIFLVIKKRNLTEEEIKVLPHYPSTVDSYRVVNPHNIDPEEFLKGYKEFLVFGANGKLIAKAPYYHCYSDGIYIKGNRIFIIDGLLNQRILEYEYQIKE